MNVVLLLITYACVVLLPISHVNAVLTISYADAVLLSITYVKVVCVGAVL